MTTDTSAEGQVGSRWAGIARIGLGIVILAAGLWSVAAVTLMYLGDEVAGGTDLIDPSTVRLPAFVAGLVLVAGVMTLVLVLRRRFRGTGGMVTLGVLAVVGVAAAALAVDGFPAVLDAKVLSIDPERRTVQWTSDVPMTRVDGVLHDGDGRITVYGTYTGHGCSSSFRVVTLDRSTGEVLDVVRSSGPQGLSAVSVADRNLDAHGLTTEEGTLPFRCLN